MNIFEPISDGFPDESSSDPQVVHLVEMQITDEPMPDPAIEALAPADRERVERMMVEFHDSDEQERWVNTLEKAIEQFPNVWPLHNYLMVAYQQAGLDEKAQEKSRDIYRRFPDYVFGIANYVMLCVRQGDLAEAERVLGGRFVIKQRYPQRSTFHVSEVISYQSAVVHYQWKRGETEAARTQAKLLADLAPEHPMVMQLQHLVSGGDVSYLLHQAVDLLARERGPIAKVNASPPELSALRREIPEELRDRFDVIVELIDETCDAHLNDEYKQLAREMAAAMCELGVPIDSGRPKSWAAGILYTLGGENFLSDSSFEPHMTLEELARRAGVSPATAANKARVIREALDMLGVMSPEWTLPSQLGDNPFIWLLPTPDGMIHDLRYVPRDVQEHAFNEGLIPYIPADRPSTDASSQ